MSSILDALNKLEKEESRQDYPLKRARADRKVFTSNIAMGIAGFVCVCIGAIGFGAYYLRSPEKTPEPLLDVIEPVVKTETQETPQPEAIALEQKRPLASLLKAPVPLPSNKSETKPNLSADENIGDEIETERVQVVESTGDAMEEAVADVVLRDPEPQIATNEKDTPDSTEDVSKEALVREEKPLPMDRLEGVSFKIQAISWGETPQERLVVISNQVLREGDGIEGYRISRINPDDIVLRRGANAYRLDFGLKDKP